jgi:hypothetical protein
MWNVSNSGLVRQRGFPGNGRRRVGEIIARYAAGFCRVLNAADGDKALATGSLCDNLTGPGGSTAEIESFIIINGNHAATL